MADFLLFRSCLHMGLWSFQSDCWCLGLQYHTASHPVQRRRFFVAPHTLHGLALKRAPAPEPDVMVFGRVGDLGADLGADLGGALAVVVAELGLLPRGLPVGEDGALGCVGC